MNLNYRPGLPGTALRTSGLKRQFILLKTSGRFNQSDGTFYLKRRDVFLKRPEASVKAAKCVQRVMNQNIGR